MKTVWCFFDGGFGEAGGLEEATGNSGVASGVEGGRGFWFVGSDGRVGVERAGGAKVDFEVVEGALGFDDAVPAERRAGFGERSGLASRFSAIGARLERGDGVAVKNEPQDDIKNHGGEREGCAYF